MLLIELSKALSELALALSLFASSTPAITPAIQMPPCSNLSEYASINNESILIPLWAEELAGCGKRKDKEFCRETIVKLIRSTYESEADPEELIKTAHCESRIRHDGIYGDQGKAFGLFQYWQGTFEAFKKDADMPHLEYKNLESQITLTSWAFSQGWKYKRHWTCF